MTASTANARHLVFSLGESSRLPDALLGVLRDEVVLAGSLRGSGILHDVQLRSLGGAGTTRALAGPAHVVILDGIIGIAAGDVSCSLRAVLARETATGLETVAGEIVDARIGALEIMVTAFDEITATRQTAPNGVTLLDASSTAVAAPEGQRTGAWPRTQPSAAPGASPAPPPAPPAPAPPVVAAPLRASEPEIAKPTPPKPSTTFTATAMPAKPVRPVAVETEDQVCPDAGDVVEHFAFGRCEVVKSDGDRLHLRLGKDGRVKEIALEMLKVTPLEPIEGQSGKHFKLDRKL